MFAVIMSAIGGLGLLFYGISLMSEALRHASGERLKKILQLLTKTPFLAILVGAGTTAIIQSSSSTTVILVGLVNAGLLNLRQAIGVVMGANIGTTVTAWLVSLFAWMKILKISHYALPAIGVGLALKEFAKARNLKLWGEVLLGFGILFLGISILKDSFDPLGKGELIKDFFIQFSHRPFLGVLAGMAFTALLQSSSVVIALIQILAFQGFINFDSALALILGCNIGTTITAQLAALRGSANARQTACAHTFFNAIGVLYMLPLLYSGIFAKGVDFLVPGPITPGNITFHIALAHTMFNISNTIVFFPLIGLLEKTSVWFTRRLEKLLTSLSLIREPGKVELTPQYLVDNLLATPPLALEHAKKEMERMISTARENIYAIMDNFFAGKETPQEEVEQKEELIDILQKKITQYLSRVDRKVLSLKEQEEHTTLYHSVNDIEKLGDHAENLAKFARRITLENLTLSEEAMKELRIMFQETAQMMDEVIEALERNKENRAQEALKRESKIDYLKKELRQHNVERLNQGTDTPSAGLIFFDFVNNFEKIGDHLTNIAQAILGLR